MSAWEASGKSDEWYTPKYIFDALDCRFDSALLAAGQATTNVLINTQSLGLLLKVIS